MRDVITLLKPRYWSFKNGVSSRNARDRKVRLALFGTIGFVFWAGAFGAFYRVLTYFQSVEGFGDILASKLLSMVIMTFFALLVFSGIITMLTKLYLSRDLVLVHSLPLPPAKIFLARWVESTIDSSWMVVIYSLPVFLSYGVVYRSGPFFYAAVTLAVFSLCLIASAVSALLVVMVAVLLPASRMRTVFAFLGIAVFVILLLVFRLMRPERLVDPAAFSSLLLYLKYLEAPSSAWLPTTWIFDSIRAALTGSVGESLLHLALSLSFAVTAVFAVTWVSSAAYFQGFSKAQTTAERLFATSRGRGWPWFPLRLLSGPVRAFVTKEIKTFLRDQAQWPQMFLIAALIVVYVYNFSVLPLEKSPINTLYLQNVISFLNMGLSAFVLVAIAARFVYPTVSLEGNAFWIVKSSPIPVRKFLWIKFSVYFLPLLAFAEILIVATNILLHVTPFMMVLSTATVFLMVPGVVAMGVGLGAVYPDFNSENPAQSMTSFGGLLFMILCACFIGAIIVLEAGPVYTVVMAGFLRKSLTALQWMWLLGSFTTVIILCALAIFLPMRSGERHLRL